MPLDPQARRYLDRIAAMPPPAGLSPAEQRRAVQRSRSVIEVVDTKIPGPDIPIPVRIYTPPGPRPLPILVYFHGGGWVAGDLDGSDLNCCILARWAGCIVVSVDYRLAPEHLFPAAVNDAYAATRWVADNAAQMNGDSRRLAVGGGSAGGNLAAVVALLARERGGPALLFQYLVYPVTDWNPERASMRENGEGYGLTLEQIRWYMDQYVPNEADRASPLVSPLRAPDLSGLPPALVITGEFDPLRDEGEAYAARLKESGVPVQLTRYDGMIHGFLGQAGELDKGMQAMVESVTALRSVFELQREASPVH